MPYQTQPFPERINNPDLANVVGYGMQESGFIDMAFVADNEHEPEASDYLWSKAYEYGVVRARPGCLTRQDS